MLAHLIAPVEETHVLPTILAELDSVRGTTGDVDMSALLNQPLLNSALNETMRLHVDSLVTREMTMDMVLDGYVLKKGDLVMAPSSLSQRDPLFWNQESTSTTPTADKWHAGRFLKYDLGTGKDICSTSWTTGKYFPFGGGSYYCPGRVFAKQEMLAAVSMLLSKFEIEFVEYLGYDKRGDAVKLGKSTAGFPRYKQQYAGNGTLAMDGDIRVRMRRRRRTLQP
jgi:cytochrome P450